MWSLIDPQLRNTAAKAIWESKISEYSKVFCNTEKTYQLGSIWAPRDISSHLVVYSGTNQTEKSVFAVLNDDKNNRTDKYEAEWNGMWRFFNIMQFLNGFVCLTTTGIDEYAYSQLADVVESSANADADCSAEWNEVFELLEYSDDTAKSLAEYSMNNNLPVPEIGYEVGDANGMTIGEVEIAWPDRKIGYLAEDNQEDSETLIEAGWKFVTTSDELSALFNGGVN